MVAFDKSKLAWGGAAVLLAVSVAMTFMKPPAEISAVLAGIAHDLRLYSGGLHVAVPVVLTAGLVLERFRSRLLAGLIAYLALSAAVVSVLYGLPPNTLVFSAIFLLGARVLLSGQIAFDLTALGRIDKGVATLGLLFGFWYLHWVEPPILLNAAIVSPLGVVNCPTLLMICGLLCLATPPRPRLLTFFAAFATLHFGLFGIFFLGAYIDVALVICALFLIWREWQTARI
ncbi:hypothetical protein RGUI_1006 [Rhodovulum sp. P5]|uniref:hypothetical protein n=1 Tax=Rhodovulum sp. P5 TaxID=1564506 RepID=UPI0009C3BA48|nr:hypothetical protein [Rhodovulum sp. P5]ARE39147.1 hypothetical protein RGUI_1006 [Rhodovulum sp. P5]